MAPFMAGFFNALAASAAVSNCAWPMNCPLEDRINVCNVEHTDGADDSPAIEAAFKKCQTNGIINFQEGITYNAFSPVRAMDLSNVEIHIDGNITLSTDVRDIQAKVVNRMSVEGPGGKAWFLITGKDVAIYGGQTPDWGWFEGNGQLWWDNVILYNRPQFVSINVVGGYLSHLKHHALPAWGWSIRGSNIFVDNYYLENQPGNGTRDTTISFPFDTQGINVAAKNVLIQDYVGFNGDDAISISDGASNVTVRNVYAAFSSHGISIGALGENGQAAKVDNILVEDVEMKDAVYGARFRSWIGGSGSVENVTFRNFKLSNVTTPAFMNQNYYNDKEAREIRQGQPPPRTSTSRTQIRNVLFENFSGYMNFVPSDGSCTTNPCWNYVEGADTTQSIILDLYPGAAQNIMFKNFTMAPYGRPERLTTVICDPKTLAQQDLATLGFVCQNGPFVPQ